MRKRVVKRAGGDRMEAAVWAGVEALERRVFLDATHGMARAAAAIASTSLANSALLTAPRPRASAVTVARQYVRSHMVSLGLSGDSAAKLAVAGRQADPATNLTRVTLRPNGRLTPPARPAAASPSVTVVLRRDNAIVAASATAAADQAPAPADEPDVTPPRVIGISVGQGDTIAPNAKITITFSEPMSFASTWQDINLVGKHIGYFQPSFDNDADRRVLTVWSQDEPLPEDEYTLTLASGGGYFFEDLAHNDLDGEVTSWPLPPGGSGDGVAGGNFVVTFNVDAPAPIPLNNFVAQSPLGSAIYEQTLTGLAVSGSTPADADTFLLDADAGQSLTLSVEPQSASLLPSVAVLDAGGTTIASATAPAPGAAAIVQSMPVSAAGTYRVVVTGGAAGTQGAYTLNAYLNAAVEAEEGGGPVNDSLAAAQSLGSAFMPVPGARAGAQRAAVAGRTAGTEPRSIYSEGFETGALGAGWSTYSSGPTGGRVQVSSGLFAASGQYALLMDQTGSGPNLNEAVWDVNLAGVASPTLSFGQNAHLDPLDALPATFTGHANGDGVAFSVDGTHWFRLSQGATTDSWTSSSIDLAAAAQAAGVTLGAHTYVKFQQYGGGIYPPEGRAYDDIVIQTPTRPDDFYAFDLAAGERVTVVASRQGTSGTLPALSLYDAAGNVLAVGASGPTNFNAGVFDFVAPAAGTYYAGVRPATAGAAAAPYRLLALVGATFEQESNSSTQLAQVIEPTNVVVGGREPINPTADVYRFTAAAGDVLTLSTSTPGDGAGQLVNLFDPNVILRDGSGTFIAINDNSAPDGHNALLTYTVPAAGWYMTEVSSTRFDGPTASGEYILSVTGATPQTNLPGAPDLVAASDTGVSSTDNNTSLNNTAPAKAASFSVTGTVPGATVTLYRNRSVAIGSAVATGTTTVVTTDGSTVIPDGLQTITARQTIPGQPESGDSLPLVITVDTVAPARPAAPTMNPSTDTGYSSTDRITSSQTPGLFVNPNFLYLRVYRDGTKVSSDYENRGSFTSTTLAAGTYAFT